MQIDRRSSVRAVLPRMLMKFSATILAVIAVGGYLTYSQVADKMRTIELDSIQSLSDGTVAGISDMIVTRDYTHLQETLRQSMDNQSITALAVTNLDGRVLSEMTRIGRVPEPQFNDTVLKLPESNDEKHSITRSGSQVVVWQRVDSLVHVGWLRLTLSTAHYDAIMSDLIKNIVLTISVMLAIIVVAILHQYIKSYRQLTFYESHLLDAVHTDALTGLPNRLMLGYYLNRSANRANSSKNSFSVAFLDLDGFKQVNDTHGHAHGDELLCEVARRLKKSLRDDDQVIRLGGDEFVIIINEVDHAITERLLARILSAIKQPFVLSNNASATVSASIGVSEYSQQQDTHAMLTDADASMYRAKSLGKDSIVFSE